VPAHRAFNGIAAVKKTYDFEAHAAEKLQMLTRYIPHQPRNQFFHPGGKDTCRLYKAHQPGKKSCRLKLF